jgi:hypothetical protein
MAGGSEIVFEREDGLAEVLRISPEILVGMMQQPWSSSVRAPPRFASILESLCRDLISDKLAIGSESA